MRRALLLGAAAGAALSAGWAAEAGAEPLRVRAGEHPGHTRLVIDAPRGLDWRWGVEGRRLVVSAPGAEGFDLAPARRVRGLSRVAALEPVPGGFAAALRCDCGARTTTLADGRIVLDLAEGAPRPRAPSAPASTARAPAPRPERLERFAEAAAPDLPTPVVEEEDAVGATPSPARVAEATPAPEPVPVEPAPVAAEPVETEPVAAEAIEAEAVATAEPDGAGAAEPAEAARASDAAPNGEAARAAAEAEPAAADPAPGVETAAASSREAAVEAARKRLLEQLTRAAEEGFLTLKAPEAPEPASAAGPEVARADQTGAEPEPQVEAALVEAAPGEPAQAPREAETGVDQAPVRARTPIEIAEDAARARAAETPRLPPGCLADEAVDLAGWGSEAPAAEAFAEARRALVGEFDAPSPEAVTDYARLLIHYGFGHEARAALESFAAEIAPDPLLLDLAAVVDGETPAAEGGLAGALKCPGAHGLWAATAAALAGRLDTAALDVEALAQALTPIPAPHRVWAARPIVEAALDAGEVDAAERLAALAARGDRPEPEGDPALALTLARIQAARGELGRADAAFARLADGDTPVGVEAMIRLVETRAALGIAPPAELAEEMEAVAFTQRASPLGRRLLAAAATARALGQGLGNGLGPALDALAALASRAQAPELAAEAAREMVSGFEPAPEAEAAAAYADAIFSRLELIGDGPESDAARIAAARRLAARGLGLMAETLLAPSLARGLPAARLAAAEGALAASEPERALTALEGIDGEAAASLRADAHARLFRFDEARAAAAEAGETELAARYAWLAGEWDEAAEAGEPERRVLAAWMAGDESAPTLLGEARATPEAAARVDALAPGAPVAPEATLEGAAAALEAARRRRETLEALLGDG